MLEWIKDLFKPKLVIERRCETCRVHEQHVEHLYAEIDFWKTEYKQCRDRLLYPVRHSAPPAPTVNRDWPDGEPQATRQINKRSWSQVKKKLEDEHRVQRPMTPEAQAAQDYWTEKNRKAMEEIPELKTALEENHHAQDMEELSAG